MASGRHTGYDMTVEPGIFNSLAAGILPLVLTLLPDKLPLADVDLMAESGILEEIPLQQTALNMSLLYKPGLYEKIVAGLVKGKSLSWDATIPQSLTHYLDGVDLASRTVQQGRDHGIPPYVVWRPLCGRPSAQSFEQLLDVMDPERIATMKRIYEDVADVDLFVGILSERPMDGAMIGPTASW